MDFDLVWILLGLPLAFLLGWLASRFDLRQLRLENRRAPKAYFKGLNYLLTEQQDKAIDAFIEAVRRDPDTAELHFALGNLFRRRGEYDRAVRVHEHLLARTDLKPGDRDRAQHALALDFLKAGLLDRAEQALVNLEGTAFEAEARLARLGLYERTGDWTQAAAMAQRLQAMPGATNLGDFSARHAHHLCEQAELEMARGNGAAARQAFDSGPWPRMPLEERIALDRESVQLAARAHDRVQAQRGLVVVREQRRHGAAATHAMPLVAQPAAAEPEGEGRAGAFGGRPVGAGDEARTAARRGELPVLVEPRRWAVDVRPWLRPVALQRGPAQPADVEVAAARGLAVLLPQRLGVVVRAEQRDRKSTRLNSSHQI